MSDDMFGVSCMDCGEAVTDERPSGETADGPVHYGCGDPDASDEEEEDR